MTIYSAVLFLHVLSAIALFIALLLEGVIFIRIRSARSIEQARFFTRAFSRLWVISVVCWNTGGRHVPGATPSQAYDLAVAATTSCTDVQGQSVRNTLAGNHQRCI